MVNITILLIAPIFDILIPIFIFFIIYLIVIKITDSIRENNFENVRNKSAEIAWKQTQHSVADAIKLNIPTPKFNSEFEFKNNFFNSLEFQGEVKEFIDKVAKHRFIEQEKLIKENTELRRKELALQRIAKENELEDFDKKRRVNRWSTLKTIMLENEDEINKKTNDGGIYVILCKVTMEVYFGSSKDLIKRKQQHFKQLKNKKHHSYLLQEAFNKYGEENFEFYILNVFSKKDFDTKKYNYTISEEEIERRFVRRMKKGEQDFIKIYSPEFNIDLDTSGSRH